MNKNHIVGISDYKIAKKPDSLATYALGSCVGVAIYDIKNNVGGLLHVFLGDSTKFAGDKDSNKFADTAIPKMVKELLSKGAEKNNLVAKIAGGAYMTAFFRGSRIYDVGAQNVIAVKQVLASLHIPILIEDVGGSIPRTMILDLDELEVSINGVYC